MSDANVDRLEVTLAARSAEIFDHAGLFIVCAAADNTARSHLFRHCPLMIAEAEGRRQSINQLNGMHDSRSYLGRSSREPSSTKGTKTDQRNHTNQTDQNNLSSLARLMAGQWKKETIPPLWDGKAAERIVAQLERLPRTS